MNSCNVYSRRDGCASRGGSRLAAVLPRGWRMDELPAPDGGAAVEVREAHGFFVAVCEHASNLIPRSPRMPGLSPLDPERHRVRDPGGRRGFPPDSPRGTTRGAGDPAFSRVAT